MDFQLSVGTGEGIEVDLLLGNKSPSPEEQGGKTPILKRAIYVNVRLIEITMGKKKMWCKPNGVQVVTGEGNV